MTSKAVCRRCCSMLLLLHLSSCLKCAHALVVPVSRAAVAFVPHAFGSIPSSEHHLHYFVTEEANILLSSDTSGSNGDISVPGVLGAILLLAIAIFATAKVTLRPELAEEAEKIRQEDRALDIISLVKEQRNRGRDMGDLIKPLENIFGTSIKEYVASLDERSNSSEDMTDADKGLAALLRTVYLSDQ